MALISTHNLIANDPQLAPRYLATQDQAISHFEDMFRLLRDDNIQISLPSKVERGTQQDTYV